MREGYKQTAVGVIPEDWEVAQCEEVISIIDGDRGANYPNKLELNPDGFCLFLNASNVTKNGFLFDKCEFITRNKDEILRNGKLNRFDIILTTRGTVGNFAYFDHSVPFNEIRINSGMVLLRLNNSSISNDYLYVVFSSHIVKTQIERLSFGSAQPQLTVKGISDFCIPLPPTKTEQTTIANALSDADAWIQSLTRLIAKKRQIKQGAMQTLLNPYENGRLKAGWVVRKLGDVLQIGHGKSQQGVVDENGIYPILASGGEIGRANQYIYDKPSVLIGRKGTIDVPQYMDKPFWTIDTLFFTKIIEPNNAKYLFYQFELIDWYSYNEASGVPSLSAKTIECIDLAVPASQEQTRIATILSEMDNEITALETKLTKAKKIKQGMMQNLLTGRIRLI